MSPSKAILTVLVFLAALAGPITQGAYSQEAENTALNPADSLSPEQEPVLQEGIPYNEILIAAGESRIRTTRIAESLISTDRIESENRRNDSILVLVSSALAEVQNKDYSQESQRFLTNENNYWQTANDHIQSQKKRLSDLIRNLQDQQEVLESERRTWENTRRSQDTSYAFGNISQVIDTTLGTLNSLASEISGRTELLIEPLNKTIGTEVEVNLLTERIRQSLLEKTSLTYSKSAPTLFELQASGEDNREFADTAISSLRSEWNAVGFHFKQQKNKYFLFLAFVVAILALFTWMSSRLKHLKLENPSYYESMLKVILQRPLTAAILFSLFFTVAFFPDRPPLLVDLTILLLLIPIMDIGMKLGPGRTRRYLWLFSVAIILLLGLRLIPSDSLAYRYGHLVLGILELIVLIQLYRHPEALVLPTRTLTRFVRFLVVFHLVVLSAGLVMSVLGYQGIAQVAIDSVVTNALVGILLFICAVILIGGLQIFISSKYLERFQAVQDHEDYLKRLVARIVIIGLTLFWLDAILRIFYMKNAVYQAIRTLFTHDLKIGSMSFSLSDILLFVAIIWLSVVLSRVIKIILRADVFDKLSLEKGIPRMITAITQFTLITLGLLMAVRSIGMPLDQLTIIFSAFSVGIGFGLQNIFNNLVSGVILLFEREVQIGDIIEVGDLMGTVKEMGIRSSHIRTFEGAEVIIPNGLLISKEVVDWTLSDKSRRIEIISGVAYGSDVRLVEKLLMEVIKKHPDVKPDPEPMVLFNALGESSLDFRLLFWTDNFDHWLRIRSEIIFAIHDTLKENDINIPFPQRDLHVRSIDPAIFPPKDRQ